MDGEVGAGGCAIGIGGEDEDLIFEMGDERAALGDGGDEEGGLADGDGLAAGLGVGGGVFDGGFDEDAGGALAEWASGEVVGKLEIEVVSAVGVGLAGGGGGFDDGDVHGGGFDGDVGVIDGLAEEVVGADGAGYVIAGAVVLLLLAVFFGEVDGYFEFGEDVALDVERDLGGVGGGAGVAHQGAEVVGAEVDFVGEGRIRRRLCRTCRSGWLS